MQNFETMLSAAQPSAHQQQSGADPQHQQQQQQQQQQSTPGGWFDLTIKSEPVDYHSLHHPMLHHNHHHHHHHHSQHLNHQQTAQQDTLLPSDPHSNPTSPQSVDSMDSLHGKGGFFDGKPTGGLMGGGGGGGYNPLGFNPLTPPGYSGLLVSTAGGNQAHQQHQLPSQHLQQQQHQRLLTPNRLLYGGGKPDIASLTPTHTPPMDVTPPKSPKEPLETPIKEDEPGSDCEDASLDDGSEDEDGIRKPKVNSHGQVKKFRCKQCDFVAVTKLNFWEHTRSHIKPEKMLTCPKCPFVTEYKHHLEYHLRNHQRSKPFQCPKCSYSCVNKSMLNSHMKSHSNVFQYRCADCNYATKYCHSLKLHLRKYGHKPDVVLNLDGTPNPLPIIDVYGTRRGPKAKPQKNAEKLLLQQQQQQHDQQQQQQQLEHLQDAGKQQDVKFLAGVGSGESTQAPLTPLGQQGSAQGVTPTSPFTPLGGGQTNGLMRNLFPHQLFPSPLAHMFKNAAANGALPLFPYLNLNFQMFADQQAFQPNLMGQLTGDKLNGSGSSSTSSSSNGCGGVGGGGVSEPDNDLSVRTSSSGGSLGEELLKQITAAAADSSACEPSVSGPTTFEEPQINPRTPSLGVKGERSRRKGRAFKLERFSERPSSSGPDVAEPVEQQYEEEEPPKASNPTCTGVTRGEPPKDGQRSLECRYCDIVFRDDVLYTIHMGYHGYDDVFKCNMCGEKSEDRIGFFLHIARKAH